MIGKRVGTQHRWKWHGVKWYRWWEMRRGEERDGVEDRCWQEVREVSEGGMWSTQRGGEW
jgi:hypothetical protein